MSIDTKEIAGTTLRPDNLTDEVKARVAEELGSLAAEREAALAATFRGPVDMQVGIPKNASEGFLKKLQAILSDDAQPQQQMARASQREGYARF